MQTQSELYKCQSDFAAYCRNGEWKNIPGTRASGIEQYRSLVLGVVYDMLEDAFPLTKSVLPEVEWNRIVSAFWTTHACQAPQVWKMPGEFLEFVISKETELQDAFPFLPDLLRFEWLETEIFLMEDRPAASSLTGDLLFNKLVLNPEHQILPLQYPVHRIPLQKLMTEQPHPCFITAHRNRSGDVIFTEAAPAVIRMLEYLQEEPLSVHDLFTRFETEYNFVLTETDQLSLIEFFENAFTTQLIAGFKTASS